jgi:hypothetical protein
MPDDHPLSLNSTSKWHTFFKVRGQTGAHVVRGGGELQPEGGVKGVPTAVHNRLESPLHAVVAVAA